MFSRDCGVLRTQVPRLCPLDGESRFLSLWLFRYAGSLALDYERCVPGGRLSEDLLPESL